MEFRAANSESRNGLISGIQFKQRSQHSEDIPCSLHFCRTRLQAHVEDYNQSAARRTRINSEGS